MTFRELFADRKPVIGLVCLPPLPGAAGDRGDFAAVAARALHDAEALAGEGCDAVLLENHQDGPFETDLVGPTTIAALSLLTERVVDAVAVPVGLSVLRNDAGAAVAIAALTGARFVRINLHVGVQPAEEGLIEGRAQETLRLRSVLAPELLLVADLHPRQVTLRNQVDLARCAHDTYYHGLADALVLAGRRDRVPPRAEELAAVREAVPDAPVLLGTGLGDRTLALSLLAGDGVMLAGDPRGPLDPAVVRRALEGARQGGA